ncbi:MAG: hypothetical protein U1F52_07905 [Burkholderiales bacterium]
MSAGLDKYFAGTAFTNDGTLVWNTADRLGFSASTVVNTGLLDLRQNANLDYIGGSGSTIVNGGTLRKSGADGTSTVTSGNLAFINAVNATLDVRAGTFDFAGGNATFQNGSRFIGAGVVRGAANATFAGHCTSSDLVLAGGNFQGADAHARGTTRWTGGQFTGQWQIDAGQTVEASGAADKNFNGAAFTNRGTLRWQTAERIGLTGSTVVNEGLIDIETDADFAYIGGSGSAFTNTGVLRKSGDGITSVGPNIAFTNPGTIEVLAGTLLLPANFGNAGIVTGEGIVQSTTFTNDGTLKPGAGIGTLTIAGHLVQTAGSITEFDIGGTASHDVLAVTGNATLGGSLAVRRANGFMPTLGDSFIVMTFANRVGTTGFLDDVTMLGWGGGVDFDVIYGAGTVTLEVTAVPEPAGVALMAGGRVVLGWAARRRRSA